MAGDLAIFLPNHISFTSTYVGFYTWVPCKFLPERNSIFVSSPHCIPPPPPPPAAASAAASRHHQHITIHTAPSTKHLQHITINTTPSTTSPSTTDHQHNTINISPSTQHHQHININTSPSTQHPQQITISTSFCVLRGRRSTWSTFIEVGSLATSEAFGRRLVLRGRCSTWGISGSFCMAGAALGAPQVRFTWQVQHLEHLHRGRRKSGDE